MYLRARWEGRDDTSMTRTGDVGAGIFVGLTAVRRWGNVLSDDMGMRERDR